MLEMDDSDFRLLNHVLALAEKNFEETEGEFKYYNVCKLNFNYEFIFKLLKNIRCWIPIELQKIILAYSTHTITTYYEISSWKSSYSDEKGINIHFYPQNFYIQEFKNRGVILFQKGGLKDNLFKANLYLPRSRKNINLAKKLGQIYEKYLLDRRKDDGYMDEIKKINFKHVVATPQTDIFNLVVFF